MNRTVPTSNDLIDSLIRQMFDVEPDATVSLARGDEQVRLRRLPDLTAAMNPLDGIEAAEA